METIEVGEGRAARSIAVERRDGTEPVIVWFGGFRSDMRATKAEALDAWAAGTGRAMLRFDYSGHGSSGGDFLDGTISRWLEEALVVLARFGGVRPVLVGSSMGAWIALLAARAQAADPRRRVGHLVLLAPAADFTERLMWDAFTPEIRQAIERDGIHHRPSAYADEPYAITRGLIEDGRRHLLLDGDVEPGCPVHVIQGLRDPDVPWEHAMRLVERLPGEDVQVTLVGDGDHRLSRPQDIDRLVKAVDEAVRRAAA